jgi:hypothetical protein
MSFVLTGLDATCIYAILYTSVFSLVYTIIIFFSLSLSIFGEIKKFISYAKNCAEV